MGLEDELKYRNIISIRRGRWDQICKISSNLIGVLNTSSNNEIILRTIKAFYGLKTSPRGSFDRFLLRELNNLEIVPKITLNTQFHSEIKNDISNVLHNLSSNTDIKICVNEKLSISLFLDQNQLFLDVIRSLPLPIELLEHHDSNLNEENAVNIINPGFIKNIQLYTFAIGLLTLTRASTIIDSKILQKIIQTVYYFTVQVNDSTRDWLRRQLELNYPLLLSDYPIHVIKYEIGYGVAGIKLYKELLIEAFRPLITVVYHDLFARNWHLITENMDIDFNIDHNYELFYQMTDNSIYIGVNGYDLTHEISICTFVNLYTRFIQNFSIKDSNTNYRVCGDNFTDFISHITISYPVFNECTNEIMHNFIGSLWMVLTRYDTLSEPCSKNLQSSIPKSVYEFAKDVFGSDLECFSSPLNTQSPHFCSLFPDLESVFGSKGNFFDYANNGLLDNHSAIIVNPPFELQILEKTVDVILQLLQCGKPLCVLFVGPLWNCDFYYKISNSIYNKNVIKLKSGSYKYRDTTGYEYTPFHESFSIVLYNNEFEVKFGPSIGNIFSKLAESWSD